MAGLLQSVNLKYNNIWVIVWIVE